MDRRNWNDHELLVAMSLYCRFPFGQFHSKQPSIIRVAEALGRTPGALAMKLCNLASLDEAHRERGVGGLGNASRKDREIWEAFEGDWAGMVLKSERELARLRTGLVASEDEEDTEDYSGSSVRREADQRVGQDFFRRAVLTSYGVRCCITGNPITDLLTASHIIPWADSNKDRLNPRNGLCLAKTQDAAFDRGLVTLDEDLRVVLSRSLRDACSARTLQENFLRFEGQRIEDPSRFRPKAEFLAWHRNKKFVA